MQHIDFEGRGFWVWATGVPSVVPFLNGQAIMTDVEIRNINVQSIYTYTHALSWFIHIDVPSY